MPAKITVVTACFNSASTIVDTLKSVGSQTYSEVEHIIVDGGSSDGTLELVEIYGTRVARVVSEKDKGIYDAMNKGISIATGDIVGFLNSDDYYASDSVLEHVAMHFENQDIDAVYADLDYVDPIDTNRIVRVWRSRPYRSGLFKWGWMPAHPTFYVKREIYERYGGFDLNYPRQADFELTLRFMEIHKIKTKYLPEIWVKMRTGGLSNSSMRGVLKGNIEAYRACKKNGLAVGPWFIPLKLASRLPQYVFAISSRTRAGSER